MEWWLHRGGDQAIYVLYTLNKQPPQGAVTPKDRIPGSRIQGVPPPPPTAHSGDLRSLSPQMGTLGLKVPVCRRGMAIGVTLSASWSLPASCAKRSVGREGSPPLAAAIDPGRQEGVVLSLEEGAPEGTYLSRASFRLLSLAPAQRERGEAARPRGRRGVVTRVWPPPHALPRRQVLPRVGGVGTQSGGGRGGGGSPSGHEGARQGPLRLYSLGRLWSLDQQSS